MFATPLSRRLRDGLLLEDLDCFTADVAGRHIGAANAAHVTAALEEVRWLPSEAGVGEDQARRCILQQMCETSQEADTEDMYVTRLFRD